MKLILMFLIITSLVAQTRVHGLWLFQQQPLDQLQQELPPSTSNQSFTERLTNIAAQQLSSQLEQAPEHQEKSTHHHKAKHSHSSSASASSSSVAGGGYGSYGSSFLTIAGIQPASLSTLLGTVGDTGFRYFNIQDQCRNRAACDLGAMLYKKLGFVHNWLVRTSVRSMADMNNIYMQSWMEGMTGRNCTAVYVTCRQSPLEGLMNLAMIQNLIY